MLRIDDITYSVEGRPLFQGATATIPEGHKVGLVGQNGTGNANEITLQGFCLYFIPPYPIW